METPAEDPIGNTLSNSHIGVPKTKGRFLGRLYQKKRRDHSILECIWVVGRSRARGM